LADGTAARPLRHCMIVDNTWPDVRVEREARALVARGHHVDVICAARAGGEPRTELVDGVHVRRVPVRRRRGSGLAVQLFEYVSFTFWAAAELLRLQLQRRFDVVQVHNVPDFLVLAALPAKATGTPVLLDLHDLMPEFFASRFDGRLDSAAVRLVAVQERLSRRMADAVITVTEDWRATLVARGADPRTTSVVLNSPDEGLFARRDPKTAANDPIVVVYHGTITYRYGIDLLVRAFAIARERVPMRLLLHGRGELVPDVRRLIDELGLADVVTLSTETVPAVELARLISTADIGVVPNRNDVFTDGILPTKLMEYAALGIPSVVSRSAATTTYFTDDMVRHVEPGDVGALADAIVELATDAELRRSLATNAQRFTEAHPWAAEAARYVSLVEGLAEARRTPTSTPPT
jgi:glycosyltransferase involved in cell wall biosynthesis